VQDTASVLVVDDDPHIRNMLSDYLDGHGYDVRAAGDGASVRALLAAWVPQVVLLDIGLPGEDGLSLARHLRESYDLGIIMVSGAGDTVDRIVGLEVGADDYLAKPFDLRELRARLKSVLRRYQRGADAAAHPSHANQAARRVRFGLCILDLDSCLLQTADGGEVPITRAEFDLLRVFAERPNRPLSREQLFALAQNRDWDPLDRSIDIRIARLRKKIEADPEHPRVLRTVRGLGYMYAPETSQGNA
jgi:two-component system phosphate regulon response regulator OmpR